VACDWRIATTIGKTLSSSSAFGTTSPDQHELATGLIKGCAASDVSTSRRLIFVERAGLAGG
jgi:hypothetical protein